MTARLTIDRCVCQRWLFADLEPRARAAGWSLAELGEATGCGEQCGMCQPYLRRMLQDGTTVFHEVLPADEEPG